MSDLLHVTPLLPYLKMLENTRAYGMQQDEKGIRRKKKKKSSHCLLIIRGVPEFTD